MVPLEALAALPWAVVENAAAPLTLVACASAGVCLAPRAARPSAARGGRGARRCRWRASSHPRRRRARRGSTSSTWGRGSRSSSGPPPTRSPTTRARRGARSPTAAAASSFPSCGERASAASTGSSSRTPTTTTRAARPRSRRRASRRGSWPSCRKATNASPSRPWRWRASPACAGRGTAWASRCCTPRPEALRDRRRENDRSCVLRVDAAAGSALLAADIERRAEGELLARAPGRLKADVLLVPHHGSRTSSSPAFVDAVSPSLAIVSAGWRNRFRQPSPEVEARYRERGAAILRTDLHGAVRVRAARGAGQRDRRPPARPSAGATGAIAAPRPGEGASLGGRLGRLAQVEGEGEARVARLVGQFHRARRVAHGLEARHAPRLGLERVHREGVVVAPARVRTW